MRGLPATRHLIEMKIEPQTKADQERLTEALNELANADTTFGVSVDPESGEIILKGYSELHFDFKLHKLINDFGIAFNVGAPQVAYRETILREAACDYTLNKSIGTSRQFARIALNIAPRQRDEGNLYSSDFRSDPAINAFASGVEKGIKSVLENGHLIGYPIVDVAITWIDGAFHPKDSNNITFEIAARTALKEAFEKAGVVLLEPIMEVEVTTPFDFVGPVIGKLNAKRGCIHDQRKSGNEAVVVAHVPFANMFGFVSELRSITEGRGSHGMKFSRYEVVPHNVSGPDDPDDFGPAIGMRA
jgi:elongation factor G